MSAGAIRRGYLSILAEWISDPALEEHLVRVLADLPDSYLQFIYDLSLFDELGPEVGLARAVAVAFQHAAVEFADDMSDGDCPVDIDAQVQAPVILAALQNLFLASAVRGKVAPETLLELARRFCAMASSQYVELRTKEWTAIEARNAAARLNGDQFVAFLLLLWQGTPLESEAESLGSELGFALHLLGDRASRDKRFSTIPAEDRITLIDEARQALGRLAASEVQAIAGLAKDLANTEF